MRLFLFFSLSISLLISLSLIVFLLSCNFLPFAVDISILAHPFLEINNLNGTIVIPWS